MKIIIYILFGLIAFSCHSNSSETFWEKANQYRTEENLKESIINLKLIIDKYPNHDLAAKAQFQIADIYLNDVKDFEFAIEEFKKVVENYPEHEMAKKSIFMVGYVYNNYLDAYSDAIEYYHLFQANYPDDELIPSVEFELESLKNIQSTIDSLNTVINNKRAS